ncbi:MAG: P1 family peptidase, partial [Gammaproteobacteria bacterium]
MKSTPQPEQKAAPLAGAAWGVEGVRVGMFTDADNHTGCTVVLPPAGTVGGVAVRGGAPGTRESAILGPRSRVDACHAVVLCGSSLFGLRAADGVVDWCEAHSIGLELPAGRFPIVGAAVVLDLRTPGTRRITSADGFAACEAASERPPARG